MVRIAVLVSGGGTNLQALIDAQERGEIPDGEIAAWSSPPPPDAFALERAEKAGIPGCVVDRKAYASSQAIDRGADSAARKRAGHRSGGAGGLHVHPDAGAASTPTPTPF